MASVIPVRTVMKAGIGAPGSGNFAEPGVNKKKKHNPVMGGMARRKQPKI